ncbi:trimeric autotransporter adhesin, partial [Panacagrimonas perspica]
AFCGRGAAAGTIECGDNATAGPQAVNSLAIGTNAQAQAAGGIAVGHNATAVQSNSVAIGSGAVAQSSVAVGTGAQALGTNTTALGDNASATGEFGVAIGNNAQATAANSVALGNGSVADQANTVSVGSATNQRRITNVARGVDATDAVNMSQLGDVRHSVDKFRRDLSAGIASIAAMSALPDPSVGKRFSVGVGAGTYDGEQGYAMGLKAALTDSINVTAAVGGATSGGNASASVGAGFSW